MTTVCVVVPVKYCCCVEPTVSVVVPAAVAVVVYPSIKLLAERLLLASQPAKEVAVGVVVTEVTFVPSSRREPFDSRPLTPPYVRFRIRRFLLSFLTFLPKVSVTIGAPISQTTHSAWLDRLQDCELTSRFLSLT